MNEIYQLINNYRGKIVCAAKYFDANQIRKIYQLGINNFGFNTTKDLLTKKPQLNDLNLTYHFIGSLQSNKVKDVINEITYLHSLASLSVAQMINKYANKVIKCFIQVNISQEATKSGILLTNLKDFVLQLKKYDKIEIVGFMSIGVKNDMIATNEVFSKTTKLVNEYQLKASSIGMSNDYKEALKYNPTFIRIGSLFKEVV